MNSEEFYEILEALAIKQDNGYFLLTSLDMEYLKNLKIKNMDKYEEAILKMLLYSATNKIQDDPALDYESFESAEDLAKILAITIKRASK